MKKFLSIAVLATLSLSHFAFAENVQVINDAVAAFEKRFEMIDRAQESIDVEYFIYRQDQSGRLFNQALIKKKLANPNLKIRILVDACLFSPRINKAVTAELESFGIEVKVYNRDNIFQIPKNQYRDHRKLLVIDGKEALTGSRNIADEYFDLNPKMNLRDRDIWVEGAVVTEMKQSFEAYWASDWSKKTKGKSNAKAVDFLTENDHDRFLRSEIARIGVPILADPKSSGTCGSVTFVTDEPGKQSAATRKVLNQLFNRMSVMDQGQTLYAESAYFITKDKNAKEEMSFLKDKNIKAILLTNGILSTDELIVAANFYPRTSLYKSLSDAQMYIFNGNRPDDVQLIKDESGVPIAGNAGWGIHSKSFTFGDDAFAIGTFNLDPRSANLNSEMLLFCEQNADLTTFVKSDIQSRISQSSLIDQNGSLDGGKSIFNGVGLLEQIEFNLLKFPAEWLAPFL